MILSKDLIHKCNEEGEAHFEIETGQRFVLLTEEKFINLAKETEGEDENY